MKVFATTLVTGLLSLAYGSAMSADAPTQRPEGTAALETTHPPATAKNSNDTAIPAQAVASNQEVSPPQGLPVYTPPRRGAPKTRVGGGTRGLDAGTNSAEVLTVLSPPQTGFTQQAQPTLYWFLATPDEGPFEFVLTTADAVEPLWRMRVDEPLAAGIHALSLRDLQVVLEDGVEYQWSVAIVRDPERRSRDLVAIGTLQRVPAESTPDGANAVFALAARGLWYDALQRVEELIDVSNDDATLRQYRAALLDQAELAQVAQYVSEPRS